MVRACQGKSVPSREHQLSWCALLHCTPEQPTALLHTFSYATPEELEKMKVIGDLWKFLEQKTAERLEA